jgi:hypothetical protein
VGQAPTRRIFCVYFFTSNSQPNFSRALRATSGLGVLVGGNLSHRWNGRQASITADRMRHVACGAPPGRQRGVGRRIPGAVDELDRLRRISAGRHRPQQMIEIGNVDVVVDHDDIFRCIGGCTALRGDMAGLHGVAGIALGDRDAVKQPRAADLVTPHLLHTGHTRIGHVLFDGRRALLVLMAGLHWSAERS